MIKGYNTIRITAVVFLIILFGKYSYLVAADSDSSVPFNHFSNPYQTVMVFNENMKTGNFQNPLIQKSFNDTTTNQAEILHKAKILFKILDRKKIDASLRTLPRNPDYIDTITGERKVVIFPDLPQLYLEKIGDKWFFSNYSLTSLDNIYSEAIPSNIENLINTMPRFGQNDAINDFIYSVIRFILLLIVLFSIRFISRVIIIRTSKLNKFIRRRLSNYFAKFEKKSKGKAHKLRAYEEQIEKGLNDYILTNAKTISNVLTLFISVGIIPILMFDSKFEGYIFICIKIIESILLTILTYRFFDEKSEIIRIFTNQPNKPYYEIIQKIPRIIQIIIVVAGIIFTFQSMNIDITAFLAGISIGGLAFALAAQETIKNLLGYFTIKIDNLFKESDMITYEENEGEVMEIKFRSTIIKDTEGTYLTIPNGKLVDSLVGNFRNTKAEDASVVEELKEFRYRTYLSLDENTLPSKIEKLVELLRDMIKQNDKIKNIDEDDYDICFYRIEDSAFDILFDIKILGESKKDELRERQKINLGIVNIFLDLGIKFSMDNNVIHFHDKKSSAGLHPD